MTDGTTDFLALIEQSQSPERRGVTDIMATIAEHYIPTQHDRRIDAEIDRLVASILIELGGRSGARIGRETLRGGRVLVGTGLPGTGKSRAFDRAIRRRPEFAARGAQDLKGPILSMVAPSPATLGGLGNAVLAALGYPTTRPIKESQVWPVVQQQLRDHGVRILLIDEIQHAEQLATVAEAQKVADTLKRILQDREWPIWLILVGLPDVEKFLRADGSMKRRIRSMAFELMRYPQDAEAAAAVVREIVGMVPGLSCAELAPDKTLVPDATDEFAGRLIHATAGRFGVLVEYVQDAVHEALIAKDEVLTLEHFADVYDARNGEVVDALNPFIAARWDLIDTSSAVFDEETDGDGRPTGQRHAKGGRRGGVK